MSGIILCLRSVGCLVGHSLALAMMNHKGHDSLFLQNHNLYLQKYLISKIKNHFPRAHCTVLACVIQFGIYIYF